MGTACPLSGRNSTYRPVQISGTGSVLPECREKVGHGPPTLPQQRLERVGPAHHGLRREAKSLRIEGFELVGNHVSVAPETREEPRGRPKCRFIPTAFNFDRYEPIFSFRLI